MTAVMGFDGFVAVERIRLNGAISFPEKSPLH